MSTTVSSTRCWRSPPAEVVRPAWARALATLALALLLTLGLQGVRAEQTEVTQLQLERDSEGVYLNAAVQFKLPPLVEEVLDKGIAIHFVAEGEVYRERWYWWDSRVAQGSRYMRLAYQPLTRRWRLNVSPVPISNGGFAASVPQHYDTLDEALEAIKRINRLRLGDAADVNDDPVQPVVFKFRLDTSQLPRPFQIGVVGQSDWNITIERSVKLPLEKSR